MLELLLARQPIHRFLEKANASEADMIIAVTKK